MKASKVDEGNRLLTRCEAAAYCRMSPRNFDRKKKRLRSIRIGGGRPLYRKEDLDHWLMEQMVEPSVEEIRRPAYHSLSRRRTARSAQVQEILDELRRKR